MVESNSRVLWNDLFHIHITQNKYHSYKYSVWNTAYTYSFQRFSGYLYV